VRWRITAALCCATITASAGAAAAAIPKPKYPACRLVTTANISAIVGQKATRQPGLNGNRFQVARGPAGHPLQISLCSWTYGEAVPNPPTPLSATVSITYFAAASRSVATSEYVAIKKMTSPRWQPLRGVGETAAAESGPSGQSFAATAIARRRNQILKVDIVTPIQDELAQRHAVAILRKAAKFAWRRSAQ
jgi:hypothetical protein